MRVIQWKIILCFYDLLILDVVLPALEGSEGLTADWTNDIISIRSDTVYLAQNQPGRS